MKHAGPVALDCLESLLAELRKRPALKEKSRGAFYVSGRAFLHFHEDGNQLYADARLGESFERFPAKTETQRKALLNLIDARLRGGDRA